MKAKKRKSDRHRDAPEAKRINPERRGKGPLFPPHYKNVEMLGKRPCYGGKGKHYLPNACESPSITLPVSQNGRRVSAPNTGEPVNQNRSLIPTPGYRVVSEAEDGDRDSQSVETDSETVEDRCLSNGNAGTSPESHSYRRSCRGAGKTVYKGVLERGKGCSCNVLVIEFDRGWRESGATVQLKSGQRGWYLSVELQGETMFTQDVRHPFFIYTTNKYTGAFMWKGDKGWLLEFKTFPQLNAFKKMHDRCFQKNFKASATRQVPTPKYREVKDLDTRWRGPAFIRPAHGYIPAMDMDLDNRVLYDMDSEDEQWLTKLNGKAGMYKQKITEHKFEKVVYNLEKYSHDRNELLSAQAASEVCLHVASLKIIKLIHGYWIEKRKRKGMSLVRHFQPERWRQFQELKQTDRSHVFAFCMPPGGFESPNANSPRRNQPTVSPVSDTPLLKEPPNTSGVENADSPSLAEVCDEAVVPANDKEAESRRPEQGPLVWKKFTGRASAEELKKLKVMNQLRESGIKHYTRRSRVPKMPERSSPGCSRPSEHESARELYALADAAMLKDLAPVSDANCTRACSDTETESEIETLEAAREKVVTDSDIRRVEEEMKRICYTEKQRLKQQMSKLKEQMKKASQLQVIKTSKTKKQQMPGLEEIAMEIMDKLKEQHMNQNKCLDVVLQSQEQQEPQQQLVSVSIKRIPRTTARFSTAAGATRRVREFNLLLICSSSLYR